MRSGVISSVITCRGIVTLGAAAALLVASVSLADIISGLSTTNSSTNVTVTNLTISKPADVAQGDVMLASIAIHDGSAVSVTAPSGWSQILRTDNETNIGIVSYWKAAGASEPANYIWVLSPQTRAEGSITRYGGVDSANPIDHAAGNFSRSKVATTSPIATTAAHEEVVSLFALHVGGNNFAGDFFSTPSGMTEKYDASHTAAGPTIASFDMTQVAAGVAGSKSSTISGNPNQQRDWVSQQISLRRPTAQIAFDNSSSISAELTPSADIDLPLNVGPGSNRMLIVGIAVESPTPDGITGVTYHGGPLSLLTKAPFSSSRGNDEVYLFALPNPDTGNNDIRVSGDLGTGGAMVNAASYTGIYQSVPTNFVASTGSGTDVSYSLNVGGSTSWIAGLIANNSNTASLTPTGVVREQPNPARFLFDTNGVVPSGSNTVTASIVNNSNDIAWGGLAVELKAAP